jgi:hypothetical protein
MIATTPLMSSIVGALQVEFGLRGVQQGVADTLGRAYRLTVHPRVSVESASFERSPNCALHDSASVINTVIEAAETSDRWTPLDILRAAGAERGTVILDWPVTVRAVCQTCRHEWEPFVRRARFRREICPACGSRQLAEIDVVSGIDAQSHWADRTLTSLGFPSGHIYEVARDSQTDRVHVEISGDLVDLSRNPIPMRTSG